MKNFDTERNKRLDRDRSFVIGGVTFTYRASVAPESILKWSRMTGGEYVVRDGAGVPVRDSKGDTISTLSEDDAIAIFDETILAFLEPDQDEQWKAIRQPDVRNPLNTADLSELVQWLFSEQSGRPTGQPSDSSRGSEGPDGTTSREASSLQAAAA